jgi:hypothetical protein
MEFTYQDYFNYYLKEFCNELIANFPDAEKGIVANYRELLEAKQSKNDIYVKYFVSRVNDHMDKICQADESLFNPANHIDPETKAVRALVFVEGCDMLAVWNSSFNNPTNKASIWKYLKLLVLFGRHVVPANTEVLELINSVGGQVYTPAKVEKTLHGKPEDLSDAGNAPDMFGLGGLSSLAGLMGLGGGLGGSGGEGGLGSLLGGMPDILKTLGDTLGNLDMSSMMNQMGAAAATDATEGSATDGVPSSESGSATDGAATAAGQGAGSATDGAAPVPGLFGDLAKEMAETFDFSSMEQGDAPANIGDAFKKFLSGDNPAKLMGLITKFGSKINSEVASGKLNQTDLLKETMGMMQGLGDPEKVKKQAASFAKANPAMAEQLARQQAATQRGGNTKSRLQAKLAARQQQGQSDQQGQQDGKQ